MKKRRVAILSIFLLLARLSAIDFWSDIPNETLARQIVDEMTTAELYSQILMFGWTGKEPAQILYDWISRGLGSVKVFGWNTDDIHLVAKSVNSLQKCAAQNRFKIPLFVATDQEGGWIRHVKGNTTVTPGNMAIGAAGYPLDAYYSAYYISREIKALGINMNFAPTIDLFTDHDSTIIGPRSFGENPQKSGILGVAWAAGSKKAGVIPTAKHFPGHGDTPNDSHGILPKIDIDLETLKKRELVPFIHLINAEVPAVMSGHLAYPQIDKSGAPASLSKYFLTDFLRGKLGHDGLIITDDITMNGATMFVGSLSGAVRMAIEAGNDIILSSSTAKLNEPLWTNNLDLIETNDAFKKRVEDAAYRVILAKLEYFKGGNAAPLYPNPDQIDDFIPDREGEKFFLEQACRSITLYKGELPLSNDNAGRVLLAGSLPEFFSELKQRYPNAGEFRFNNETGPNETQRIINNIVSTASGYNTIVILVASQTHAKIAESLKSSGKKVIVFSILSPAFAENLDWADTILMGYSRSIHTLKAMSSALAGDFEPKGRVPFD